MGQTVPLTADQQKLVEEYARQWNPIGVLRSVWPGLWKRVEFLGLDVDEVEAVCWLGVTKTAGRYDPARGATFATAASWGIRGAVSELIRRAERDAKLPVTVFPDAYEKDGPPALAWKAMPAPEAEPADDREAARLQLAPLLAGLPYRERCVLQLRYGLVDGHQYSRVDAGRVLGVSWTRVIQQERRALARIQSFLQGGPAMTIEHDEAARPACPDCGTEYANPKYRRCKKCKPSGGGCVPKARRQVADRPPRKAGGPDLQAAMTAAETVREALAGLDRATAAEVVGWVMDRLDG